MLIELSYPLSESAPKWPTNPDEKYYCVSDQKCGDVSTTSSVYHHLHNGTHFDAPRHFDPNGLTIDRLPIEDFYYTKPYLMKLDKKKGEMITMEDALPHLEALKQCDLLMIYTGYSRLRAEHPAQFMDDFPFLSPEFARYLRTELPALKGIALDVLSVDSAVLGERMGFPAHHALLETNASQPERTLRIFEDVNIGAVLNVPRIQAVCAFPVRWVGLEAAPVAITAII